MNCPSCGHENREGARFCNGCGNVLSVVCPACHTENAPGSRFCDRCGSGLEEATAPAGPERDPRDSTPKHLSEAAADNAERRQLTVMFCDLADSTELSERLDAEELRGLVRAYQQTAAESIERYEGHIAQYLGDGLLVYFGYPRAHEDDAVRGVTASLAILEALPALNEQLRERYPRLGDAGLEVRIGVHTGPVVIGEMGGGGTRERLALGDTVNLAARLQGTAAPGQTVMSEATRALVRGVFVTEHIGQRTLKGIEAPVAVHRVLRATGVQSRLELAGASGLTPLVGREQEVALLLDRWEQVTEGHGQVVLLSGDAGIGKSRLVQAVRERLVDEPHSWLEARASAYHVNSALHPVIGLLEQALLLAREDSAEEKVAKLEAALGRAGFSVPEVLPLFATLLSVPLPERHPPLQLSPEAQRQRTLESLVAWLFTLTGAQPLVLVVEDLHWIDPSTLELLGMLLEQAPTVPVLLLLTFRPDFEPPWASRSHLVHLTLHPLTRKQIEAMVERVAGGKALPALVLEQLVAKTDGVPLFVEELTKTVLESNLLRESDQGYERSDPLPELAIPSTLQDSLMARLDRLGPAKEVAQLSAMLGREFPHELLAAVSPLEAESLEQALRELANAELLFPRGVPPRATYTFKHALIQDTAYESLLKSVRQGLHGRIAEALEKEFPERAQAGPELVAHHYDRAGRVTEALPYYQRAGDEARARSANAEAIAHLERGVELTQRLPEGTERDERELELELSLGPVRNVAQGYAREDTRRSWERARVLSEAVGSPSQLVAALRGLAGFHSNVSELGTAIELAEQLLALARRSGDEADLVVAYEAMGNCMFLQGRFRESLEHCDAALDLWPKATRSYSNSGMALLFLGYPERAAARAEAMVEHARTLAHPYSLAYSWMFSGWLYLRQRAWDTCARRHEESIELSERYGFPFTLSCSRLHSALAIACTRGDDTRAAATEAFRRVLGISQASEPERMWILARVHQEVAGEADALAVVETALASPARLAQPFCDAELLRLKGELLLARDEAEAESHLHRALEVARGQEARFFELRAATTLARLWQRQGKKDEARGLLAPVYDWFTEGFDTPDLKDAKALLDELA